MRLWHWLLTSALLLSVHAKVPSEQRVLVIFGDRSVKETHSLFFKDLEAKGFALTFKGDDEKGVNLAKWGEYSYDNLIIFAPTADSFGRKTSIKDVMDFVDSGRNLILVGSSEVSKRVFDVAADCGMDFESTGTRVLDHVHYAKTAGGEVDHGLIVVQSESRVQELFDKRKAAPSKRPLLFRGIGHSVAPDQDLVTVAVAANPTSYSWDGASKEEEPLIGRDVTLVSLMQTTNNGRVAVVGSLEFFGDEFFTKEFTPARHHAPHERMRSGNQEFCHDLALWTFQSIGALRTQRPRHFHGDTGATPAMYTVNDPIHFEVEIMEYVLNKWKPYRADDVQLEYFMMYPYIRTQLLDRGNGTFALDLKAPDVYGVFKFLVTYHRPGYSNIDITEMAPIRPYRHDEYERFILTAYPYYASVFSMMIGFWIFGITYLYHK